MSKYTTEFSDGRCTIEEINWNMLRDYNRMSAHWDIDGAINETIQINEMIEFCREEKRRLNWEEWA